MTAHRGVTRRLSGVRRLAAALAGLVRFRVQEIVDPIHPNSVATDGGVNEFQ